MRSLFNILFVALFIIIPFSASSKLIKFEKDGKFGYKNESNQVVLKAQFPIAYTDTITEIGFVCEPESNKILCINNLGEPLFLTFKCDNGPDYPHEGLFRIIDNNGLIGYADLRGNIVISPIYKFAYPFVDGKAKVTSEGYAIQDKEYIRWEGNNWYYILNPLLND